MNKCSHEAWEELNSGGQRCADCKDYLAVDDEVASEKALAVFILCERADVSDHEKLRAIMEYGAAMAARALAEVKR